MNIKTYIHTIFCLLLCSCGKDWLEAKPSRSLLVPTVIRDYQAILDNTSLFNAGHPALGMISADDYYIDYSNWQAGGTAQERNCYIWNPDIYEGETRNFNWNTVYKQVLYTNIVLEGLEKLAPEDISTQDAYKEVKGSALFFRALGFFNLAQLFCQPYSPQHLGSLGLPLRISSNVNRHYSRSTLSETYSRIMDDLLNAASLLPANAAYKTRPSRLAAFSLLARANLVMGDYGSAYKYADSALYIHHELLDYNTLNTETGYPFVLFNNEVSFHYTLSTYTIMSRQAYHVDTTLYDTYTENDLRKKLFFSINAGRVKFRGSYAGSDNFFGGFTAAEMYLIRAESAARLNDPITAMHDLNALLIKRWKTGAFVPLTAANAAEALDLVLRERRKELLFRGLRWPDIKRFNLEPDRAFTLTRRLNNQLYELPPNDKRYVLPLADEEIQLGGLQQNER